jgi:predicted dehydrogenase
MVNKIKRALIIGIGSRAHIWKNALDNHPDWELAAIVDTDTDKLGHAPQMWGIKETEAFTSMEEALEFGEGPYNMAIIETPTFSHHVLAMEALENGLNVICDKNMASTIEQARDMVKTAQKYPHLCTAIGTQSRYFPQNWSLKKYYLEHQEQLGPITSLNLTYLYNWGKTRQGWRRWLRDLFLEDMAPHHLDLIRYLTDMDVVEVKGGVNFRPSFSYFKGSSTTFSIFALSTPENYHNPDNWVYVTYRGDWQKKGRLYHQIDFNCEGGELNLHEENKEKTITATLFTDSEGYKFNTEPIKISSDIEYNSSNYASELYLLEEMSRGIDSNGKIQPKTNFKDAIKTFSITRGIVDSFKLGKAIFLPDYWKNLGIEK